MSTVYANIYGILTKKKKINHRFIFVIRFEIFI